MLAQVVLLIDKGLQAILLILNESLIGQCFEGGGFLLQSGEYRCLVLWQPRCRIKRMNNVTDSLLMVLISLLRGNTVLMRPFCTTHCDL